jgi:hypothetical protein
MQQAQQQGMLHVDTDALLLYWHYEVGTDSQTPNASQNQ